MGNMCFRLRTKNMRKDLEFPVIIPIFAPDNNKFNPLNL